MRQKNKRPPGLFSFGRGWVALVAPERQVVYHVERSSSVHFGLLLGMCERVRMRNTLHEVGARLSTAWRYPTVLDWRRATARAKRTATSHFSISLFSQLFHNIIIIFFQHIMHSIRISIKSSKTRVNSTRFQAI